MGQARITHFPTAQLSGLLTLLKVGEGKRGDWAMLGYALPSARLSGQKQWEERGSPKEKQMTLELVFNVLPFLIRMPVIDTHLSHKTARRGCINHC